MVETLRCYQSNVQLNIVYGMCEIVLLSAVLLDVDCEVVDGSMAVGISLRVGKMQFHHFWSTLVQSFWLFLEKFTIATIGKNLSDSHRRQWGIE